GDEAGEGGAERGLGNRRHETAHLRDGLRHGIRPYEARCGLLRQLRHRTASVERTKSRLQEVALERPITAAEGWRGRRKNEGPHAPRKRSREFQGQHAADGMT